MTEKERPITAGNPLADVVEIRECRIKEANELLKEGGWELQAVQSCSIMRPPDKEKSANSYVQRFPGYILIRRGSPGS